MRFLVVFILFFSVGLTNLQADTVDWKGITWYVGGLAVGRVEVDPVTDYLQIFFPDLLIPNAGVSYLTTPEFQAAPGSWVEAKFLDSLGTNPTPRIEVQSQWLGMILFASFDMFGEYYTFNWSQVLWDLTSLGRGGISLKRRSLGEHTVKIAKRINSVVEFWLDGDLVYNFTPPITPVPGFYSVGLQAFNRGRQTEAIATFTDYRAGIERPVCDVKSIRVDRSLSNGVIDAEVSGEPCEATITLKNLKNFRPVPLGFSAKRRV